MAKINADEYFLCIGYIQYELFLFIFCLVFSRHQTHYEQFGDSEGTLDIEGHGSYELKIKGLRDHSYGE